MSPYRRLYVHLDELEFREEGELAVTRKPQSRQLTWQRLGLDILNTLPELQVTRQDRR